MKKSIKKADIIEAVLREKHLQQDQWFTVQDNGKTRKNCPVCVVGSVLRAMSFEKWAIKNKIHLNSMGDHAVKSSLTTMESSIDYHLKEENFLAALSCYFESDHGRYDCIKFVIDHFPDVLTITVNKSDCKATSKIPVVGRAVRDLNG